MPSAIVHPAIQHPVLVRLISRAVGAPEGALSWETLAGLAASPHALSRLLLGLQDALEEQDQALAKLQSLLDDSSTEALRLNRSLEERAQKLEQALAEREAQQRALEEARQRLLSQEKMASIGTLAAGIAHEINTPTQFVGDNLSFLNDAFRDLMAVAEELLAGRPGYQPPAGTMDLEFLRTEIPAALQQSVEGLERVAKIVRSVKEFSHPGATGRLAVDLNRAIQSTLTVCRNEWKYVAEVECDLAPDLPLVPCVPGEINQVLLNLIINAAQAIQDRPGPGGGDGRIWVSTRLDGKGVRVRVADNGCGIPAEAASRVYDPFFTTKEVGRGTGQGLAIARSVVANHGGEIGFAPRPGGGTEFTLWLPLAGSPT